eukprot:395497_1
MSSYVWCFVILIGVVIESTVMNYNLGGSEWLVMNSTMNTPIKATVPGVIYIDLMNADILDDPYYGWNSIYYQWVATNSTWTYSRDFTVTNNFFNSSKYIQLICDGLDTKADIYINNKLIFTNNNQFHRNWIELKQFDILKLGINSIKIEFWPKPSWAMNEYYSCNNITDGYCPYPKSNAVNNGFDGDRYVRTEQCSFGWDWGPAFAPIGIWKNIYLQGYNHGVIRDFLVYTKPINNTNWTLEVIVYIDSGSTNILNTTYHDIFDTYNVVTAGTIKVSLPELNVMKSININITEGKETNYSVLLDNINPELWWPTGWGSQKLYEIIIEFYSISDNDSTTLSHKIGFRTIELIQDNIPGGRSFFFRINNIDVPIHGSNFVPADTFQSKQRINRTTLEKYFVGLRDSNQNMIRNWGGGIYQDDEFYNLADEYGILIWEDFMFAEWSGYWGNANFLKSVSKETIDTVRYLQYRPCIAIWAGNNEDTSCSKHPTSYSALYFSSILDNIEIYDASIYRPRVVGSPSMGNETESNPCMDWSNIYYGDKHYYNYQLDCWNWTTFLRSRFQSEFGYISWAGFPTMSAYVPKEYWSYNSSMMYNRQQHPNAQSDLLFMINQHYNLPNKTNQTLQYEYMLYMTQVFSSYCYKTEVEFLRSTRNDCNDNKPGCNMGQMYWSINNIGPWSSPASIDWKGRYKMNHYFAQHFYKKFIIVGENNSTYFNFWYINDYVHNQGNWNCIGCNLQFISYSWMNGALSSWNVKYNFTQQSAKKIYSVSHDKFLTLSKCKSFNECILKWVAFNDDGKIIDENWMFLDSPKSTNAKDPQLQILNVEKVENYSNDFRVTFSCKAMAVFVWLEIYGTPLIDGYFEDNGLFLEPGTYDLILHVRNNYTNINDVKNNINIWSLYEVGAFMN